MNGTYLNTVSFSDFTDLTMKSYVLNQAMVPESARSLFIKETVGAGQGNTKRFDEVDSETYASNKAEGAKAKKARFGIGYNKTMTKKRIAIEIDISQEMRDENRYSEVGTLIRNLAHFCPQRIELDLTHRLTFATSTSYTDRDGDTVSTTGGDGLAIVSTVHTLRNSSLTWSNQVTGNPVFSQGALESAELLTTTNILSNFGERRVMNFNTIVTSDNQTVVNSVKQFLNSTADVNQDNSAVINVYKGKYSHVILPQLATTATGAVDSTKKNWWFLVASGQGQMGWQAYYGEWEAPHMKPMTPNAEDFSADVWTYGTRAGYGIVVVTGRGLIASCPTS